jgi:hypothetical protein
MQVKSYPIESLHSFSKLLIDYLAGSPALATFYGNAPQLESFEQQILEKKSFSQSNRAILHEVIQGQYHEIGHEVEIDSILNENTYTVTTGHQLNIFTGPLYVIYKIVSTINLAKKLKATYPKANFIPVYWMATEDHDWDEINHFYWLGKKFEIATAQKGAVGRFSLLEFEPFLKEIPNTLPAFQTPHSTQQHSWAISTFATYTSSNSIQHWYYANPSDYTLTEELQHIDINQLLNFYNQNTFSHRRYQTTYQGYSLLIEHRPSPRGVWRPSQQPAG